MNVAETSRFRGCLLGLAAGDAVGTSVEFKPRGSFEPVTEMTGGGPFGLSPGEWTDDTSMALCLAASLLEKKAFDPRDQADRYVRWWREGYMSSNGRCFDIGITIKAALEKFVKTGDPISGSSDPRKAGNGCIMRLAPVPMYFHPDEDEAVHHSGESSRTTHGADECIDASRLFGSMIHRALSGESKEDVLFSIDPELVDAPKIRAIAEGSYREKGEGEIRGNGYVVNALEAALWCFDKTDTYRAAILKAANLGEDADTTAAIAGQLAGAFYGEEGIPADWLDRLVMRNEIGSMAEALMTAGESGAHAARADGTHASRVQ